MIRHEVCGYFFVRSMALYGWAVRGAARLAGSYPGTPTCTVPPTSIGVESAETPTAR